MCYIFELQEELHKETKDIFLGYYYYGFYVVEWPLPNKAKKYWN